MVTDSIDNQIKSKERVQKHGEVNTNLREINAMLDLVKDETLRIESKFLEPACGDGNFLIEVLRRKKNIIKKNFSKTQHDFEKNTFIAITSIYGIDILEDNVTSCQERILDFILDDYNRSFKKTKNDDFIESLKYVISKNIILGDAITLKCQTNDLVSKPIIFSDWTMIGNGMIKRKDFIFSELVERSSMREMPLFSDLDDEDQAFIPTPIKEYPLIDFLEIMNCE